MDTTAPMLPYQSFTAEAPYEKILGIIQRGWPVLPLHYPVNNHCSCSNPNCTSQGKHPITTHGLKDASASIEQVKDWWRKHPKANCGILTGEQSGIVVLDVDPRHGGLESLEKIQREHGTLPRTLKVQTGGKGFHFYFRHPGSQIRNRANILPGLDFRGDGGYIVAPPSVHISQSSYIWENDQEALADLPSWLQHLLEQGPAKESGTAPVSNPLGEGSRNSSLTSIAGVLMAKGMEPGLINKTLEAINLNACHPPLDDKEVRSIVSSISRYEEKPWDQPTELPQERKPDELSGNMLPEPLRSWCLDIADRMQVPLEYPAGAAIVMISTLIGRKITIKPKKYDDWEVVPNLWGCVIAPPGSMKSPVMSAVLKPLQKLAVTARQEFLHQLEQREKQKIIAKTEVDALKESLKSAVKSQKSDRIAKAKDELDRALSEFEENHEVAEKRYITNDPTIEKLLAIVEANPQGLLLFRDELGGWLESMYKSGREGDREFFLESWNGDTPYSMDRIGRGSTFVDGLCLSVLGGLQPSKFDAYVASLAKGGKSDDGLLQRFQILFYPEKQKRRQVVDRNPNVSAKESMEQLIEKLAAISAPERKDHGIERPSLSFNTEAQHLADSWAQRLEDRLSQPKIHPIFEAHLSKYRSLMPSLALIFEVIGSFSRDAQLPTEVSRESVERATELCSLLESHARKAFKDYISPGECSGRLLLAKIKDGSIADYDKCRDIYRRGWKGLNKPDLLEAAIIHLKEHGWLRTEYMKPPTGSRSEVVRLHPTLRT